MLSSFSTLLGSRKSVSSEVESKVRDIQVVCSLYCFSLFLVLFRIEYQNVPIEDQRRALVLLYELAFQYGTLHQIIKVIIVSINLCICHEDSSLTKMPLGSILQRLRNLMKDGNQIVPSESVSGHCFII